MVKRIVAAGAALAFSAAPALAHLDPAAHGSVAAGFSHPLFGLDHVLVMVAVGLWAAALGGRALVAVPSVFMSAMGLGFAAALFGMPLPLVEPVILSSVVFIGLVIALALPFSTPAMMASVAFFAFFHGHAHGGELGAAGVADFALGFIAATAVLHATGVALGAAFSRFEARQFGKGGLTRGAGLATAAAGVALAVIG